MKLKKKIGKFMQRVVDHAMGNGLMQEETAASGEKYITQGISALIRRSGAEGCVLLKNDGVLPLKEGEEIAVFGRCQLDWFCVGYGSGGDVHAPYRVNLMEGLGNMGAKYNRPLAQAYRAWCGSEEHRADEGWWGHWPMNHPEMPLAAHMAESAAKTSDAALVVIGRAAGEDRENTLEKGSYYLTEEELAMLDAVTAAFRRTAVVLNIGSIMDMEWTERYGERLSAVLIAWQGGMESGNALADVLYGKVNPCGRLADTIARRYEDYPSSGHFGGREYNEYAEGIFVGYRHFDTCAKEAVLYPFGYGLSYTEFRLMPKSLKRSAHGAGGPEGAVTEMAVEVKNIGGCSGREVVMLWCRPPKGCIEKPAHVLTAFAKTRELAPGESQELTLKCDDKAISSYDERRHAFLLEPGEYRFAANDVEAGSFLLQETAVVEKCEAVCSPEVNLRQRILDNLPGEAAVKRDKAPILGDVASGKDTMDDFVAGLSDDELEALTRGHGMMNSPLGAPGNAGVLGGVIPGLREKGVLPVVCADGPAGLRLQKYCALVPCGTALACTWNCELVEELYRLVGAEMKHYGVDVLLAPGMNIHRNPLCGRNFEYFSEDPLLSGKMAAAVVRGVQSMGGACCPKHFACNNQETKRNICDSRLSERALREIYLRNFEICIRESSPHTVMTSYNKVNGVWSHYNYDLVTTVLRREWGYEGMVMTDWWMQKSGSPEFPKLKNNAYRVRAQVDVLMPGDMGHVAKKYKSDGSLLKTLGQPEGITRGELQRTARNVLELVLKIKYGEKGEKR